MPKPKRRATIGNNPLDQLTLVGRGRNKTTTKNSPARLEIQAAILMKSRAQRQPKNPVEKWLGSLFKKLTG